MYARSTTVRGNSQTLDDATVYLRDKVMPAVQGLAGFVGLSMLADRETGRCIATTAWESEEAMHDSEGPLHQLRRRYADILGGRPEVQEWEIALLHRQRHAPDGACARVVWTRTDPGNLDAVTAAYRDSLMPWWEQTEGFCSNSFLVDRQTGRCSSTVVFESREAMAQTRDQFTTLREEFVKRMAMDILEVAEFDMALAHLRVPETV